MAEDFRKLLDFEMKKKRLTQPVSAVAYLICDINTQAFANLQLHVSDCQQTANESYAKMAAIADELRAEIAELKAAK